MSLAIQVADVHAVLLADGWHDVANNSFDVDAYEFLDDDLLVLGGGQADGVVDTGFRFIEHGCRISGPLTSILAVRHEHPRATYSPKETP